MSGETDGWREDGQAEGKVVIGGRHTVRRVPAMAMVLTMMLPAGLAALGAGPGLAVPVTAASAPSMTADPATNLSDGQYVKLALSGFPAGDYEPLRQCIASASNVATDCTAVDTHDSPTVRVDGTASTYLPVYAGGDPLLKSSDGSRQIPCDYVHPCVIAATHNLTDLSTAVFAAIAFQAPPESCPPAGANAILGSGSSSAYRAIYGWQSAACRPPLNLPVGYTVSNSVKGGSDLFNGLTDFGVTGPLPPPTVPAGAPKFEYAPLTASAVTLAFRIFDRRGPQLTSFVLTPELIAQLYLGGIQNLNASQQVKDLNPGVQFPSLLTVFARAEGSAQTYGFTSWLSAAAPSVWTKGAQTIFPLPPSGVVGRQGNVGPSVQDPLVPPNTALIGYMDSSTAAFYGLPTVLIRRPDGSTVAATPDTIRQAIGDATANADGTITPSYATADPAAYPIVLPTYLMAPTTAITPDRGAVLASFLRYAVKDGQATLPAGYAPLPANLVDASLKVAGDIPGGSAPAPGPGSSASGPGASPAAAAGAAGTASSTPRARTGTSPARPAATAVAPAPVVTTANRIAGLCSPTAGSPPPVSTSAPGSIPAAGSTPIPAPATVAGPAAPAPPPAPCPKAASAARHNKPGPALRLAENIARLVLPAIVVLALLCLIVGASLQVVARRRGVREPKGKPASSGAANPLEVLRSLFGRRAGALPARD